MSGIKFDSLEAINKSHFTAILKKVNEHFKEKISPIQFSLLYMFIKEAKPKKEKVQKSFAQYLPERPEGKLWDFFEGYRSPRPWRVQQQSASLSPECFIVSNNSKLYLTKKGRIEAILMLANANVIPSLDDVMPPRPHLTNLQMFALPRTPGLSYVLAGPIEGWKDSGTWMFAGDEAELMEMEIRPAAGDVLTTVSYNEENREREFILNGDPAVPEHAKDSRTLTFARLTRINAWKLEEFLQFSKKVEELQLNDSEWRVVLKDLLLERGVPLELIDARSEEVDEFIAIHGRILGSKTKVEKPVGPTRRYVASGE